MEDSILFSVKKMLLIADEDDGFDPQIIMYINAVLGILTQLGVGPKTGYAISDASSKWVDFLGETELLEMVKSYVPMKVKLMFDNGNGTVNSALEQSCAELEWRINAMVDPGFEEVEDNAE